jgi:hypothetical protein
VLNPLVELDGLLCRRLVLRFCHTCPLFYPYMTKI